METSYRSGVFEFVTPPVEKPLARADAHLEAGRLPEAVGAYRAVLRLDPTEARAHLGLAQCAIARGQRDEAVEALVASAAQLGADGHVETAMHLYAGALLVDPDRLELHVDVAELETACGRADAAKARLRALVAAYERTGRSEEAAAVAEFLAEPASDSHGVPTPIDHDPIVEIPPAFVAAAPTVPIDTSLHLPEPAPRRRAERRAAVRWRPGGSPNERLGCPEPAPEPAPTVKVDEPVRVAPEPVRVRPVAPSDLARRLRERSGAHEAVGAGGVTASEVEPADRVRRLARTLATITARHKPMLRLRPRKNGAVLSVRTVKPSFEEEPTRVFERPQVIPPPPL